MPTRKAASKVGLKKNTALQASRGVPRSILPQLGKRYNHKYTSGPFTLPLATHSIDWALLNNDSNKQTVRVSVFKCPVGQIKSAEPPGPLEVTLGPGETTHNANAAVGGFSYEIQVETNSRLVFPYAAAWAGSIADPMPGSVVKSAEFIRQLP